MAKEGDGEKEGVGRIGVEWKKKEKGEGRGERGEEKGREGEKLTHNERSTRWSQHQH